jgi:hypothetical protein
MKGKTTELTQLRPLAVAVPHPGSLVTKDVTSSAVYVVGMQTLGYKLCQTL